MIIDAKDVIRILDEYEKDLFEKHMKVVLSDDKTNQYVGSNITIITAAQIQAVREIRDRLKLPEIKA